MGNLTLAPRGDADAGSTRGESATVDGSVVTEPVTVGVPAGAKVEGVGAGVGIGAGTVLEVDSKRDKAL